MASKSEADRLLYEYQRQLDAPKVFSEKYPNISKAVSPTILHKSDKDIYNTLGENTSVNTDEMKDTPFDWYRTAEEGASGATARDFYKTDSPLALIDKLKAQDAMNYKVKLDPSLSFDGIYKADENEMALRPDQRRSTALDTSIHEHGHAQDFKASPEEFSKRTQSESDVPLQPFDKSMNQYDDLYKNKNLYDLSDAISTGHFIAPRSHSINTLIDKATELGKQQGLVRMPDQDPKYNELNYIKPTLKELRDYPTEQTTLFKKLSKLLGK